MADLLSTLASWQTFLAALLVFGLFPGFFMRLILMAYPKGDPRRTEALADLHVMPTLQRPMWVMQQVEPALCDGLPARWRNRKRLGRTSLTSLTPWMVFCTTSANIFGGAFPTGYSFIYSDQGSPSITFVVISSSAFATALFVLAVPFVKVKRSLSRKRRRPNNGQAGG